MNEVTAPANHVRFVIGCITALAMVSALCGGFLLWKGYAGGGELVMTVNTAIAGMIGFLSNRQTPPLGPTQVTVPPGQPLPVTEEPKP